MRRNIKILWINQKKTNCEINRILDLTGINLKVVLINMSKEKTDPDQRDKGGCDNNMSSREQGGRKQRKQNPRVEPTMT